MASRTPAGTNFSGSKTFFHSTSFTGNALACAAAVASLKIWEEEPVQECIDTISGIQAKAAARFAARDDVLETRYKGTILALDVKDTTQGYLSDLGPRLYRYFLENDVLLRPIGNTVYVLPPYCVTKDDLEKIYDTINNALDSLRDDRAERAA